MNPKELIFNQQNIYYRFLNKHKKLSEVQKKVHITKAVITYHSVKKKNWCFLAKENIQPTMPSIIHYKPESK